MLQKIEQVLYSFYKEHNMNFNIDTLRINFQKTYKINDLKKVGTWKKIDKKNKAMIRKLQKRLTAKEISSLHQLNEEQIYYYNISEKQYRKATLVIYGLMQYHKEAPKRELILKIISILKNISQIDICFDMPYKPNIKLLMECYNFERYITKEKGFTDTYYLNKTDIIMIDKVVVYNKALKNDLDGVLWRIEATMTIPNIKLLALPLEEFKELVTIAKTQTKEDLIPCLQVLKK